MRTPSPLAAIVVLFVALAACDSPDHINPDSSTIVLRDGSVTVAVQKSPFLIVVTDADGTLLSEAKSGEHGSLSYWRGDAQFHLVQIRGTPARQGARFTFDVETTEGSGANAVVTIELRDDDSFAVELMPSDPATVSDAGDSFVAPARERFYGLTERIVSDGQFAPASEVAPQEIGSLDRRGEIVPISVAATISVYTPFLHSSRGYGLLVDGPMQGSFDVAASDADRLEVRFRFDPSQQRFRYYVFPGPGHAAVLDQYTALTGRPWLPPRWAYKHMRWRDEHASGATAPLDGVQMNADVVDDVTMYEQLGFPTPGWYAFDRPWSSGPAGACPGAGFARFEFDPLRFPNASEMIAALATRGTRTIVWGSPWMCGDPTDPRDNAFEAARSGYLAPNDAIHLDFTNPDARQWWEDRVGNFVRDSDIAGFKLDRGDETVPSDAEDVYADGRNGLELHNDYPRLYVKSFHDALQAARPDDWVTMTRPGYAGSQAYGIYWGGDITGANTFGTGAGTDKGLRSALISLQRMAFMGFPNWGTDTGGYYQFKQRDVFARWLQFSALCPLMEIGGSLRIGNATDGPHAPWDMPTEPHYDEEMIDIYRFYTWLHHDLLPYSYSEGVRASRTGHPIATPLVFEYPDDSAVGDLWDEYLYGPWLLVAPVWRDGERERSVYLPTDGWTDFWDDTRVLNGPVTLSDVAAPLDRLPLYIKLGAILPLEVLNSVTGFGSEAFPERLTLALYPHRSSRYALHDELGNTIEIVSEKDGGYDQRAAIRVSISEATKEFLLRIKANYEPARVTLNGTLLPACADLAAFEDPQAPCNWLSEDGLVRVKFSTDSAAVTVDLTPGDAPAAR